MRFEAGDCRERSSNGSGDLPCAQVRSYILHKVRAAEHLRDLSRQVLSLCSHSGAEVTLKLCWRNILLFHVMWTSRMFARVNRQITQRLRVKAERWTAPSPRAEAGQRHRLIEFENSWELCFVYGKPRWHLFLKTDVCQIFYVGYFL